MNIKIWLFIVIVLAVLIIGYVAGRKMAKGAECTDCGKKTTAAEAVQNAAGTVVAAAATAKQGMNVSESQKG
jgi:uncharacterized protein (UPF0333 family)